MNPDDVIKRYGADSLRLYEMFMGPLEATKPWDENGVKGVFGFLARACRFFADMENIRGVEEDTEIMKALHQAIKKVTSDIENLRFNTAISALMIFTNSAIKKGSVTKQTASVFARLLSPFAPHLAEELWQLYGNNETITYTEWPEVNEEYLREESFEYPVSFNGKLRFKISLPLALTPAEVEQAVIEDARSAKWLGEKGARKVIVVPGRIVNVVV